MVRIFFNIEKVYAINSINIHCRYYVRGEKSLIASSINRNMLSPDAEEEDEVKPRQRIGKTDCIGYRRTARREDGDELLLLEVVGFPSKKNEQKHKRDRAALLKGMKLALDRLVSTMLVDRARRIRVYGILVYGWSCCFVSLLIVNVPRA